MDVEHGGVIEDPVKSAEKRVLLIEVLSPQGRTPVAGEDDIICPFLVVPPVDEVKEEPCVLLVELAVSDLVDNETGRADKAGQHGRRLLRSPSCGELVPELRGLNEIGLQPVLAAFITESLSKMRLPGPGRADKSEIPVGIDRSQGADILQLFQVYVPFPPEDAEVEILKGLGGLLRESAHTKDRLDLRMRRFVRRIFFS